MKHICITALLLGAMALAVPALAQDEAAPQTDAQSGQAAQTLREVAALTEYTPAQVYFPCRVLLPAGYDPALAYPLVVGLHGFGGDLDRFATLWFALDDPQFILAVPQAPYAIPPVDGGGASWLPKEDLDADRWDEASVWTQEYILAVVRDMQAKYNVDATYLLGFSQGGMIGYTLALHEPGLFTGVAGIGTVLPPTWASDEQIATAKELRVFIAHSPEDGAVSLELAQETRDRFIGAGLAVEYVEYAGGHTFTSEALETLAGWLAEEQESE